MPKLTELNIGFLKALKSWTLAGGTWKAVEDTWIFVSRQGARVFDHLLLQPKSGYTAVILSLAGIIFMFTKRAWLALLLWGGLGAAFTLAITFYFHLKPEMIWIQDVFLIPAFAAQAFFAGIGLAALLSLTQHRLPQAALWTVLVLLLGALLYSAKSATINKISQRDQYWAYDFGRDFIDFLPKNTIIFAEGDFNTMPIYYLQHVENRRPDVIHLTTIFLSVEWGVEQLKARYPELGLTVKTGTRKLQRQGDGALLLETVQQLFNAAQKEKRPLHASLFREVLGANAGFLQPGFVPWGLSAQHRLDKQTAADEQRRLGILNAMRSRYWQVDRDALEPSPAFALSNYASAWMDLGVRMRQLQQPQLSLKLLERAVLVATHPNLAEAYTHLGIAYNTLGKLEESAEWFLKSAEEKPLFEAWANLAGTYNQLKRYPEAEKASRKALELNAQAPQNWNNLGIALYYQNKVKEAIAALENAKKLAPGDAQITGNLKALKALHP